MDKNVTLSTRIPAEKSASNAEATSDPVSQMGVVGTDFRRMTMTDAGLLADAMPELCDDCGGMKADDSTPKWVFRQYDICTSRREGDRETFNVKDWASRRAESRQTATDNI